MFRRPDKTPLWSLSPLENKRLVAKPDVVSRKQIHCSQRSSKSLVPALGSNIKASNVSETCLDFCKFVSKLLQVKHVRKEQADFVTHNVWRDATLKDKQSTLRL